MNQAMRVHEGNGKGNNGHVVNNGRVVLDDTPERRLLRAQIGTVLTDFRPLLEYAAASRVNCRFNMRVTGSRKPQLLP